MRVAIVTRWFPPAGGGAEKAIERLACALAERVIDVTVITSGRDLDAGMVEFRSGVAIHVLPCVDHRFWGTWRYMRSLKRWFAENSSQLDVCLVSMLKHCACVAVRAGKRHGFPVVLRPSGTGPTGDIAWQQSSQLRRWIGDYCRDADAFVANSPHLRAELIAARYPTDRIYEIPNGVSIPAPYKHEHREKSRQQVGHDVLTLRCPVAVYAGRLSPEKGLEFLVDSWSKVFEAWPTAQLVLVGSGPEEGRLRDQVARKNLTRSVYLVGSEPDVEPYLRAADVFVLPSLEEAMSNALLEAMALGLPVVATDIPGNRRLIEPGRHGLLVPPRDANALADAIVHQLQHPDHALEMGQAARARVAAEFSLDQMVRRHLDLFEFLCRRGPKK